MMTLSLAGFDLTAESTTTVKGLSDESSKLNSLITSVFIAPHVNAAISGIPMAAYRSIFLKPAYGSLTDHSGCTASFSLQIRQQQEQETGNMKAHKHQS
jgi:hypothetical protein